MTTPDNGGPAFPVPNYVNAYGETIESKPSGMTLKSKMDGSFGAENYLMTMEQTMEGLPTGAITMTGTITGKRLGDCPA